jgi:hypothetical protein
MRFLNDTDNPVSAYPTHDVRFIMAAYDDDFVGDWIRGAWGQADVWDRADNFIRLKRRGKVPSESPSCRTASILLTGNTGDAYFIAEGDFADVEL